MFELHRPNARPTGKQIAYLRHLQREAGQPVNCVGELKAHTRLEVSQMIHALKGGDDAGLVEAQEIAAEEAELERMGYTITVGGGC